MLKAISLVMCILGGEVVYACNPVENSQEERLYALLDGINGWIGIENDIWLGEEVRPIKMEFISSEVQKNFDDLLYEIGGTPTAMNQSGKMKAAPCLYAIGTLAQPKSKQPFENKQNERNNPTLRIRYWFVVVPYLLSKNPLVEGQDLEVDIKQHLYLPQIDACGGIFLKSCKQHEYSLTTADVEPPNDYHQLIGLYPVVEMELESEEVVVLLSGVCIQHLHCKVQFKDKEEAVRFFQKGNQQKINDAKRMGEPPAFYLVGRYDMKEKKFIADRFMCEKEITQNFFSNRINCQQGNKMKSNFTSATHTLLPPITCFPPLCLPSGNTYKTTPPHPSRALTGCAE